MTIRDFVRVLSASSLPRNEARLLLAHVLDRDHAWLVAHDDYEFTVGELEQINALAARRAAGEPIAYLLGVREFYGRAFRCSPAALIPRPETELLIDQALARLSVRPEPVEGSDDEQKRVLNPAPLRVLDVGTGTGCIAITIALERPDTIVTAIDISPDALALAHDNALRLQANVTLIRSNWFAALPPDAQFDLILSNPPYIAPGDAHLCQGDLRFEPSVALADAVDGLESYRQLLCGALRHLISGGWLVVEHGFDQGVTVPEAFLSSGFVEVGTVTDLAGHPRVTRARKR